MPANSLDLPESVPTTWSWKPTTAAATGSAKARAVYVNPYAAPQTIELSVAEPALPVAEFAATGTRQLYPEQSTAVLAAMVRRSDALNDAQAVWFLGTALGGCVSAFFFVFVLSANPTEAVSCGGAAAVACALSLLRFYAGVARKNSDRYFAIGMDWLLFTVALGLGVWIFWEGSQGFFSKGGTRLKPTWIEFWLVLMSLPFLFYPAYYALRSLKALCGGQLLFGPERLEAKALKTELDYRQLHRIE